MTQNLEALERGNAIRIERAELRAELRAGSLTFSEALGDPRAQRMVVWKLLPLLPRWGMTRINELSLALIRKRVMIGYGARVRSLTVRQRLALIAEVEGMERKPSPQSRRAPKRLNPTPELVARRATAAKAQAEVETAPPRCTVCNARLLEPSPSGKCGFCEAEAEEAA